MHIHNNNFQNVLLFCHLAFFFKPFSFHLWNTPASLCWFSPTIVFVMPSQQTDAIHITSHQSLSLLIDDQRHFWEGMLGYTTWYLRTQSTPHPIHNFRGRSLIVLPHQPIAKNYFLLGLHWTLRIQPNQKLSNGTIFHSCLHGYAQTRICHSDWNPKGCLFLIPLKRRSHNHSSTLVRLKRVLFPNTQIYQCSWLPHFGEFCLLRSWTIHKSQWVHSEGCHKCL